MSASTPASSPLFVQPPPRGRPFHPRTGARSYRAGLLVVALLLCCTSLACASTKPGRAGGASTNAAGPSAGAATVERLVDGDTLILQIEGARERVRLIGIDTPETKDPRRPVQCFGKEASHMLATLLPPGTAVRVERDAEARDKYGRLLLYVWRSADNLFVNLQMARDGAAAQLTIPPNVAHADEFGDAVAQARSEGKGLWGACGGPGRAADDVGP